MRQLVIWIGLLCATTQVVAQDSLLVLSKDDVVSIVKKYHPIVRQADVLVDKSEAAIMTARGGFDPKLNTDFSRKTFDRQFYYSYFNPSVSIPTWYGVELKAGVEEIYGERVSDESTLGKTSYAGVNIPVTRGLLFDERRATLRQAQVVLEMSEAERRQMVNTVLYDALTAYWLWVKQYNVYSIYTEAVALNKQRYNMVKNEFLQGNSPAIDTVEALAQLQSFMLLQNEALMEFTNAGYELSNYLWLDNNQPVAWNQRLVPDTTSLDFNNVENIVPPLEQLLVEAANNHPKIQKADTKIDYYEIERRLKAQQLRPNLDISANLLSKGYGMPQELTTPFLENNHKIGVGFSMPLLLRKERGAYKEAKLKKLDASIERDYVQLEIENKIKSYYNEVLTLQKQIELYRDAYSNFARLLNGELIRFDVGESTVFLVNARENKLLDARQKLLELQVKWHKSYAGMLWASGVIQ